MASGSRRFMICSHNSRGRYTQLSTLIYSKVESKVGDFSKSPFKTVEFNDFPGQKQLSLTALRIDLYLTEECRVDLANHKIGDCIGRGGH